MDNSQEGSDAYTLSARTHRRHLIAGITGGLTAAATGSISGNRLKAQAATQAAVVSSHYLATEAGVEILEAGGTAADAAVAVAAVLSVVEPYFSSVLGGGTWGLYFDAESGAVTSIDGVGPVGSLATLEDYRDRAGEPGMHQANVPGAWAGWMLWLEHYGQRDLGEILGPAIRLASEGFPVNPPMASYLERYEETFSAFPDTVQTYEVDGELPASGDTIQLPDLAATLQSLSDAYDQAEGDRSAKIQAATDYFYRGPIAEAIVAFSEENDGYFTMEDFAGFETEILQPISIDYRGLTVYQNPPNSQGIAMLMALNILKGFDMSRAEPSSADSIHVQVEAIKLAFADRYAHVGDPAFVDVPVESLLSDEYGRQQRDRIDLGRAMEWPIESELQGRGASHTTTFHILDPMGNAAAVTTSIGFQFRVVGQTGIHINERNKFLSLDEGNPNVFAPGKKVRHTSCPYIVLSNGSPTILGGNTGVDTQPQAQIQQFVNMVDFGFSAQEVVDEPRFVSTAFPATTYPYDVGNTLQMEDGFADETITLLEDRGHQIAVGEGIFGSANVIAINRDDGTIDIGTESRTDEGLGVILDES